MAKTDKESEKTPIGSRNEHLADSDDIFSANSIFPDASAVFTSKPVTLNEIKDSACIVLDTNPLLVPFASGAQTLSEIETTYTRLLKIKSSYHSRSSIARVCS